MQTAAHDVGEATRMFWGFAGTVRWSHGVNGAAQVDCDITLGKLCDNQSARRERLLATWADTEAANDGGLDLSLIHI